MGWMVMRQRPALSCLVTVVGRASDAPGRRSISLGEGSS
jgi:hypothetical protein